MGKNSELPFKCKWPGLWSTLLANMQLSMYEKLHVWVLPGIWDLMSRSTTCAILMNQFITNESVKCLNGDSEILTWSEWLAGWEKLISSPQRKSICCTKSKWNERENAAQMEKCNINATIHQWKAYLFRCININLQKWLVLWSMVKY